MIIDAHAHLIPVFSGSFGGGELRDCGGGRMQFLDGSTAQIIPEELYIDHGFTVETLVSEMDKADVGKALLIQAYYYGIHNLYVAEAVAKYPDRFLGVGSFDPYTVQKEKIMDLLIHKYQFRCFKFELSEGAGLTGFHPDFQADGPVMEPVYRRAAQENIAIIFDVGKKGTLGFQIDNSAKAARSFPSVRFVVCHLLAPELGEDMGQWTENMKKLAACDNIVFDIAALPWNVREAYPYSTAAGFVRRACDLAGADRLIWGSDVPCVLTLSSYREQYAFLKDSGLFSRKELEMILGGTAERLFWNL